MKTLLSSLAVAAVAALCLVAPALAARHVPKAEVIGIPRAVAVAETAVRGRALEAELDYAKGRLVYEITAVSSARMHEIVVDAVSGEIVSERPRRIEGFVRSWVDSDKWSAVRASGAPLAETLAKIEADNRARVREVGLTRERGQTVYEVELADAGRRLLIDPRTGAVREGRPED